MKVDIKIQSIVIALFIMLSSTFSTMAQKERKDVEEKYKWDLTDLFESDDDWRAAKDALVKELGKIETYKGKLGNSAADLLACLKFNSDVNKEATLLYIYTSMNSDLDTRNMKYSGMKKELQQIFSDFGAKAAFVNPEILAIGKEKVESFIASEPGLQVFEKGLKDLFRSQEHVLSNEEERIMALSGMISGTAGSTYNTFKDAELPSPKVTLSDGTELEVSSAAYSKYRASSNREDRHIVFDAYWNNYKRFEATFGEMMYGNIKSHWFNASARNYKSCLQASLDPNDIPVDVYHSLIENVNKNLPAFHRYLKIKKRMLGVDTLKYLDLYAPTVKDLDLEYNYEDAKDLILDALKPLGKEYTSVVDKAFENRWIDVYPTTGKRSGAYSNGAAYDIHPYILLNYNDLYSDVSTTAHELGHTMQSYLSNKKQPYELAGYPIFVAEVASTFNEVLLFKKMKQEIKDDNVKLSLLMDWLDGFKGTLFRQTQFAEFELRMHEAVEKGMPLTGETLSNMYKEIVDRYYGHDKGVCFVDDYIEMEWAYIPHFYYNFYVYQYSTSFTASISLAEKVLNKEKGAVDRYIDFLSAGGSDYPINLLKTAGVDMTSSEPFEKTIEAMNEVMDEIEAILDKK